MKSIAVIIIPLISLMLFRFLETALYYSHIKNNKIYLSVFFAIADIILLWQLSSGQKRFFLLLVSDKKPSVLRMFDFFINTKSFFLSIFSRTVSILRLIFLLAISFAPGVIIFFIPSYFYIGDTEKQFFLYTAVFLLTLGIPFAISGMLSMFLNPYIRATGLFTNPYAIMNKSVQKMKGNKTELFYLYLKYIPLLITCILIIPAFFILPRFEIKKAAFARKALLL